MKQIEDTDAVKRIMSASVVTFSPDDPILQAIETIVDRRLVGAPVVDDRGSVVGALTYRDCVEVVYRAAYHDEWSGTVSEYMKRDVRVVDANRHIVELPELVAKAPYPLYPVVEEGRLVGQITPYDILKTLLAFARQRGWQTSR
ncbi:MAG: CBS domain-containing protein [Myxococcota bacterium]|nr:CBS domain-containing protein [Myxococcota bacterium]